MSKGNLEKLETMSKPDYEVKYRYYYDAWQTPPPIKLSNTLYKPEKEIPIIFPYILLFFGIFLMLFGLIGLAKL